MLNFLTRIFGSRNDRMLKGYARLVREAAGMEAGLQALPDEALRGKTQEFRERLQKGEALSALQAEAFAVVREAARRVLKMRHFDVQLIGGAALHEGKIAEMRTGEGKTLVATLPAYLNALPAEGVHVVTVNEYLAQRDADWMGPVYRFLGLTVGVIRNQQSPAEKRAAYASMPATSPTAPTTSSASTTCATTSRSGSRTACSAASPTRSSTRSTRS
ncbi:MAG: hypothetical protein MUF07_16255 [Steroidobacteraceae bacterium]|nr:hypothetical protein [Steroidobacteraceae bacterium]